MWPFDAYCKVYSEPLTINHEIEREVEEIEEDD